MEMIRIRKPINVTLDPELVGELDAWLHRQTYKVSRAQFIEAAIRRQLDAEQAKERKERK